MVIKTLPGAAVMAFVAVAGCASPELAQNGEVAVYSAQALPPPTLQDLSAGARLPLLGPGDIVRVEVFGLPDMSREVRIDAGGNLSFPLAGTLSTTGHVPETLARSLEERLRENYVRDPQVTVSLVENVSQVVTVEGEVRRPGIYPINGKMTLMRAIARAEGTSENAESKHVVVFRTVEGRQIAALYDLRAIQLAAYEDPQIYQDDVVVVGESTARRLFPQILQGASLLLTPLLTVLR